MDSVHTGVKQTVENLKPSMELANGMRIKETAENTHAAQNYLKDTLEKFKVEMRTSGGGAVKTGVKGAGNGRSIALHSFRT